MFPWKTLNHALGVAYSYPGRVQIRVVATPNTPIAPVLYGGHEATGWTKPSETPGSRAPFPIRLFDGVSIKGEIVQGQRPRIFIDEGFFGEYSGWQPFDWQQDAGLTPPVIAHDIGTPQYTFFLPEAGAKDVQLQSLWIDGAALEESKFQNEVSGVWAINTDNLYLFDCKMDELHDGVIFYAHGDVGGGVKGQLDALILGGEYSGSWPHQLSGTDKGHAGVWMIGEGFLSVDIIGSASFRDNHDGVEIAGTSGFGTDTIAELTIDRAMFDANDNGLEIVGPGSAVIDVSLSQFLNTRNQTDLAASGEGGGVFVRGMSPTTTIRDCTFRDNAYSINWLCGGNARLDIGNCATPGGNLFEPYTYPTGDDYYRCHVLNENDPSALSMLAFGNTWIPGIQNADVQGVMPAVPVTGPENTPAPGPNAGPGQLRNFSILSGAVIDFQGGACP